MKQNNYKYWSFVMHSAAQLILYSKCNQSIQLYLWVGAFFYESKLSLL